MPLKLIERVLPWLVGSLGEEEAKCFLKNMYMAGDIIILDILLFKIYHYIVFFIFIFLAIAVCIMLSSHLLNLICLMQLQLQMLHLLHFFLVGRAKVVK